MPKTKTAKKELRKSGRNRARNVARQGKLKGTLKTFRREMTAENLSASYKTLDKLAKSGFIKKNKANRLKSRLSKRLAKTKTK
jgi:small subunit ribosomal protein S20